MDVRTFEAFSMKDAIKSVKRELGADAVILSTREKSAPEGKGLVYEVTAAAAREARKAGAAHGPIPAGAIALSTAQDLDAISTRLTTLTDKSPTKAQMGGIESGMAELKLLLIEALRGKDGSTLDGLPAALVPIDRQLRAMGISETSIVELMRHLMSLPPSEVHGEEEIAHWRDQAIRWMMKRIKIAPRWTPMPGSLACHAVVGTAGCGKTALVAKLAAHFNAEAKARVGVISIDQRRLAASEQMRVFCKIVAVPFATAPAPQGLKAAVEQLQTTAKGLELILIDTAGTSPKDAAGIEALAPLKDAGIPVDFHLAIASTEKESQMDRTVRAFATLGLSSLAFTRLDEAFGYGEMFNLARTWGVPLSFFSVGQEIPEDLERASRERVIERIFGL